MTIARNFQWWVASARSKQCTPKSASDQVETEPRENNWKQLVIVCTVMIWHCQKFLVVERACQKPSKPPTPKIGSDQVQTEPCESNCKQLVIVCTFMIWHCQKFLVVERARQKPSKPHPTPEIVYSQLKKFQTTDSFQFGDWIADKYNAQVQQNTSKANLMRDYHKYALHKRFALLLLIVVCII